MTVKLYHGNCTEVLKNIESQSVDAVITDPPYPCIKRDYGYWTVDEWWELVVENVIPEVRRILKPTGSAMFILQPNSEHVGQMRGCLWEFMAWVCKEWNMIQDVYWWNYTTLPTIHTNERYGLMRPSVKYCVWAGNSKCYRNQLNVLWDESIANKTLRLSKRCNNELIYYPSGAHRRAKRAVSKSVERNGRVTPFNLLPLSNTNSVTSSGASNHGAGTPLQLTDWWVRYIVPSNGTILDPFVGAGTVGIAAIKHGHNFIGIDKEAEYIKIAQQRIDEELAKPKQLEFMQQLKQS